MKYNYFYFKISLTQMEIKYPIKIKQSTWINYNIKGIRGFAKI